MKKEEMLEKLKRLESLKDIREFIVCPTKYVGNIVELDIKATIISNCDIFNIFKRQLNISKDDMLDILNALIDKLEKETTNVKVV